MIAGQWFSLPDEWNRTKDANQKWHVNTCHSHPHKCMADILGTILGRTNGDSTECKRCWENKSGMYQITWNKAPELSRLPISLEFELDPQLNIPAELEFTIGGIEYTLLAVVFGNSTHFMCNVKLEDRWYHYDGIQITGCQIDDLPATPLFRQILKGNHMTPPPTSDVGYTPTAYRYMRTKSNSLAPVLLTDVPSLPTERQFGSMWRLV